MDYLKKIYYTPGNPYQVVKQEGKYKIGKQRIRQILNNEDSYSLYKPIRKTFPRSKVTLYILGGN